MEWAIGGSHRKRMAAGPLWLGILVLAACGGDHPMEPTRLSVTVSPPTVQRLVGGSLSLRATVKDAGGNTLPGHAVTWTTSNTAVATVVGTHTGTDSTTALIKGVGPGTATIAATAEGQSGSAAITVVPPALAFTTNRDGNDEIYVTDASGTDVLNLTNNPANDDWPSWSPDGPTNHATVDGPSWWPADASKASFSTDRDGKDEVYVINAGGTALVNLTNNTAYDGDPGWSPDGSKIAFDSDRDLNDGNDDVYVMNADGTGLVNLTHNPTYDFAASWRPTGGAHAASPLRLRRPASRRRD